MAKIKICVENETQFDLNEKLIIKKAKIITERIAKITKALERFEFDVLGFDILFCKKEKIKKINREFRKIDKETDVITFALFFDDENRQICGGEINLGEIIICPEVEENIPLLIAHGILHLFGFDHQTNKDYNFVVGVQNEVIEDVKIPIQKF